MTTREARLEPRAAREAARTDARPLLVAVDDDAGPRAPWTRAASRTDCAALGDGASTT
jgi:hypothetical protein